MLLSDSSWPEIQAYLSHSRAIVIPIGSTEQHGPVGIIGTDAATAGAIALALGDRTGVLVAPTLALSVERFNLGFPGTIALRASTLMAVVIDCLESLAAQGFETIYFLNRHGGNIAPVGAATQDFYFDWSSGRRTGRCQCCRFRNWWEYPEVDRLRQQWWGAHEGLHATPSEISIVLAEQPTSSRLFNSASAPLARQAPTPIPPGFARDYGGDNHFEARVRQQAFPDGRVGSHSMLATAQQGAPADRKRRLRGRRRPPGADRRLSSGREETVR